MYHINIPCIESAVIKHESLRFLPDSKVLNSWKFQIQQAKKAICLRMQNNESPINYVQSIVQHQKSERIKAQKAAKIASNMNKEQTMEQLAISLHKIKLES